MASILTDLGAGAAAFVAIVAALGFVIRSRPTKWLWRRVVAEPITNWQRAQFEHVTEPALAEIRQQLRPNGGSSLRDRIDQVADAQAEMKTDAERRFGDADRRFGEVEAKVDRLLEGEGH